MSENITPHFHNEPGVAKIRIGVKIFMCMGALPPLDHPHIYIEMKGNEAVCPYCSTRFVYDEKLGPHADPGSCEYTEAA